MAKKEFKEEKAGQEMSLEEARAYRASLYKPKERELSEEEKKEQFKLFWTQSKKKYGNPKDLEHILWLHLKATGNNEPGKFEEGLLHFGLKKRIG